jgi:hypothetical protein
MLNRYIIWYLKISLHDTNSSNPRKYWNKAKLVENEYTSQNGTMLPLKNLNKGWSLGPSEALFTWKWYDNFRLDFNESVHER